MDRKAVRLLTAAEMERLVETCAAAQKLEGTYMANRVFDLSRRVAAEGDENLSETLRFLSGVLMPSTQAILKIDMGGNPFWVAPSTVTEPELALLRQVADAVSDPEIKARFADFVWLAARDWKYGEIAVDAYLDSAQRLRDPEEWSGAAPRYERAAVLARSLGKKKPRYARVIRVIEDYLDELDATDPLFMTCRLMEILLAQKEGDPLKYAALAEKAAHAAESRRNFYVAQFYWDLAANWNLAQQNTDGAQAARIGAAESLVKEAESRAQGESASYLAAAGILQGAIALLQKSGGSRDRIAELFRFLKEYESNGLSELKPMGRSIDLTDLTEIARQDVADKSLPDAIAALVGMVRLPQRQKVRSDVLQAAKDYPLQHLFGEVLLDPDGAAIAGRGSVDPEEEGESHAILSRMYEDVIRTFSFTALGQIDPARRRILEEHNVREIDVSVIVQRSWFVPPGRDVLFSRGLFAGFEGDFLIAIHLLTPQIEAALRWNLRRRGHNTTRLNRDNFQEEMDLNQLLSTKAAHDLLGENLQFALQALLTSRFGFNLRNRLAHGLLDVNAMYSTVSEYFWA